MRKIFNNLSQHLVSKYPIRIIISLVAGFASLLVVPSDSFIINKLGKTLFFALISGICYLLTETIHSFSGKLHTKDYDIVADFYNVINEERAERNEKSPVFAGAAVGVREKVTAVSLSVRDVMIGTVRSPEQLKYNLENNCYYTPARFVKKENLPVKCIAIYEDGDDGAAFIKRKAMVYSTKLIKRKNIPLPLSRNNGEEDYYYFNLKNWELMENPIIVKDTYKGRPLYTNMFLLDNCKYSYQMVAVNSFEEYKLIQKIEEALNNELETHKSYRINREYSFKFENDNLIIVNKRGKTVYKMSSHDYLARPRLMFDKIKKYTDAKKQGVNLL